METFGCCSHYKKCSENGTCLFPGEIDYEGCCYSKNLLQRNNFYLSKKDRREFPAEKKIFLDCFDRNFKISRRGSTGLSYPLNEEEYMHLLNYLKNYEIPIIEDPIETKSVMEGDYEEPANSKVIFKIPEIENEFIIGNFNQCLILKRYSDGIEKALIAKGLSARVELLGSFSHKDDYQKADTIFSIKKKMNKSDEKIEKPPDSMQKKPAKTVPKKLVKKEEKKGYIQLSLFEPF